MTKLLMIVGLFNFLSGFVFSPASGIDIAILGKHILVSCFFFWMAYVLYELRKQTDLLKTHFDHSNKNSPEP